MKLWQGVAAVVVVLGLAITGAVKAHQLLGVQDQLNQQLMQANLELGKAHTQFGDASNKIKELDSQLQAAIKANKEQVQEYSELLAKYQAGGGGSGSVGPNQPSIDNTEHLVDGRLYLARDSKLQVFVPPLAFPQFKDQRLTIDHTLMVDSKGLNLTIAYQLHMNFRVLLAKTISATGAVNDYADLYEVDAQGNTLGKLELTKFESIVNDERKPHLILWAPHLDLGLFGGFNGRFEYGGSLGFSVAGFGLTQNDLAWRFGRIGVDMANKVGLDLEPVLWNFCGPLPLLSNLWVGPMLYWDGQFGIGVLTSVVL